MPSNISQTLGELHEWPWSCVGVSGMETDKEGCGNTGSKKQCQPERSLVGQVSAQNKVGQALTLLLLSRTAPWQTFALGIARTHCVPRRRCDTYVSVRETDGHFLSIQGGIPYCISNQSPVRSSTRQKSPWRLWPQSLGEPTSVIGLEAHPLTCCHILVTPWSSGFQVRHS
jgi:hypothetical protein